MAMEIAEEILEKSKQKALEIMHIAENLRYIKRLEYNERRPSYEALVSSAGYRDFHPTITIDVMQDFKKHFKSVQASLYNKYLLSDTEDEANERNKLMEIARACSSYIENDNIFENTIPPNVKATIENLGVKGFTSPKLSKLLAKLCSERSRFWSWFTTKCPKKIVKGTLEDYKIFVSVLPHHIAGMSYYSSYNFGGKKWEGYGGTSCQDPKRNSGGGAMDNLPASVKDSSLAVAFLTKADKCDLYDPVYEARALIRVVELKNGNVFYVVLRQFGYTESVEMLVNGLKEEYPNNLFINRDIYKNMSGSDNKNLFVYLDLKDIHHIKVIRNGEHFQYEDSMKDDSSYRQYTYFSYNDDDSLWTVHKSDKQPGGETTIRYRIPKEMLISKGLYSATESDAEQGSTPQVAFQA